MIPDRLLKLGGLCGLLLPPIAISTILIAISKAPWFIWEYHCLSDLGVSGTSALIFNNGIIISGLLAVIFGVFLVKVLSKTKIGIVGTIIFIISAVLLMGVGIFPETTGDAHLVVSFGFFILVAIAMLIIGIALIRKNLLMGILSIILAFIVPAAFFIPWPGTSCAIAETIGFFPLMVFSITFGIIMIKYDTFRAKID
jgi:hypothetical membrane protein